MSETAQKVLEMGNRFMVGVNLNGQIRLMRMPIGQLSKEDALNLAAWLVALAETEEGEFQEVLEAVKNT